MAMLFAAGGPTSMTNTLPVGQCAFTDAERLKPFERGTDDESYSNG